MRRRPKEKKPAFGLSRKLPLIGDCKLFWVNATRNNSQSSIIKALAMPNNRFFRFFGYKIPFILFCLATLLLANCSTKSESNPPIRISLNTWPGYAHAFIAKEKGYFTRNGVQVELVYEKDYRTSRRNYATGDVDGIFEVYADAIIDSSESMASSVVYVSDYSVTGDAIMGKPEFKDLSDLKGKTIGVDGINSFSNLFVIKALEKAGVKEYEIRFEVVSAQDIPAALENGIIDAGHTWEPAKSAALKKGYKILADAQYVPGLIVDVLVFNDSAVNERPKEIKAIIKSLFEALDFIQNNKEEALQIMSKFEDVSIPEMKEGLHDVVQPDENENLKFLQKTDEPPSLFVSGNEIIEFYLNRGQLSHTPDLNQLINSKFVEELRE